MKTRIALRVEFELPRGATAEDAVEFLEEAIEVHAGETEGALSTLDTSTATVALLSTTVGEENE